MPPKGWKNVVAARKQARLVGAFALALYSDMPALPTVTPGRACTRVLVAYRAAIQRVAPIHIFHTSVSELYKLT